MGFLDRLGSKKKTRAPAAPVDAVAGGGPTHFFVVSGNPSVIEAYHGLFRMGAPAYGGSAQLYRAETSVLESRAREAAGRRLPFPGVVAMGGSAREVEDMAGALQTLRIEAARGQAHVAYVAVGPSGVGWVREVYATVLGEAVAQMILPFHMLSTEDEAAAAFLKESLSAR